VRRLRVLAAAAAIAAFAVPPPVAAQGEQRLTESGCIVAADMVLAARSLAVEKIERPLAERVMGHMYENLVAKYPDMLAVRDKALVLAYGRSEVPKELARLVAMACMRTGGDLGAMFGAHIQLRPPPRGLSI
jgi:hypothetical protein